MVISYYNWFSEIAESPETGEANEAEANEDTPASGAANNGYDMTDNSAYCREAGAQSSSHTQSKPVSGAANSSYNMTDNSAYYYGAQSGGSAQPTEKGFSSPPGPQTAKLEVGRPTQRLSFRIT